MNLKVSNSVTTKTYALTNAAPAKPYLNVSNSFLPLTTNTTSGLKLKVTKNNNTYRALEYGTVSSSDTFYTSANVSDGLSSTTGLTRASTSGTTYLTRASTSDTKYGTRASTSNTVYGTRVSTSGTKYGTRVSTSTTIYQTRASTSGTTYYTRASTSGTISSTYYTESVAVDYYQHYLVASGYYALPVSSSGYYGRAIFGNTANFWSNISKSVTQYASFTVGNSYTQTATYVTKYDRNSLYTNDRNHSVSYGHDGSYFILAKTTNQLFPWSPIGNYGFKSTTNAKSYYSSLSSCVQFSAGFGAYEWYQKTSRTYSTTQQSTVISVDIWFKPGSTYIAGYLTRASTSGTKYGTRASTSNTVYGTRASTSGTTYLTRASTSGTTYYTRVSTSGTTYLTRASTSGTNYGTRASTSGYSGVSSSSNSTTSWI